MNLWPQEAPEYLRSPDAAELLRKRFGFGAAHTLGKLRWLGGGPPFRKIGRLVVYEPADLIAWAEGKIGPRQRSTSEAPPQRAIADAATRRAVAEQAGGKLNQETAVK